jgi:hypothetical protein
MDLTRKGSRMATPEEQIAELTKSNETLVASLKLAEAGTGGDDEARKRLIYLEDEHKKIIKARDDAKEEKRLADEVKLTEQGEFKILADKKQQEIDDLTKQLTGQGEILTKIKERDEAKLQTLIGTVPDNFKGLVENSTAPLAERIELAETLATVKPTAPGSRPGGDTHTATLQEEYNQAVKDKDLPLQFELKRKMFPKG